VAVPNDLEMLACRTGRWSLESVSFSMPEIHLSHFTTRSVTGLLSRCGFQVIHVSLDPFWVVPASEEYLQGVRYLAMESLHYLTGVNLYPAIWAVAQKPD